MRMIILAALLLATACVETVTIEVPTPATSSELRRNLEPAARLMVQCRTNRQRHRASDTLTAAQILFANNTFAAGEMPRGCAPARPPEGTRVVLRDEIVFAADGRRVWFVDMYYPSNLRRPWRYVVANRRF